MIIVTGGAGFIGSNIIKGLNDKGITDILVVDNLKKGIKVMNLTDLKITDYLDKQDFLTLIKTGNKFTRIDAIFHKGACSHTTEWNGSYMLNNNYLYSKKLLNHCLEHKIPFLYASSAAIYGNRKSNFIESREYECPLNVYGYSKFLFDEYVRLIMPKKNSQIVGLRYFNVYGPREGHKGGMASMAFYINNLLNKGKRPKLFKGSDRFKRDFIYIIDAVAVNLWFFEHGISGIFNLGTGCAESFQAMADIVLACHKKSSIEYIPFPDKLKGHYLEFTQADLTKLRSVGYDKLFKNITEGLTEYIAWLNHNTQI